MNHYKCTFTATCPNDGQQIVYRLHIRSYEMIYIEDLLDALPTEGFHELIADHLYAKFGGDQTITAIHKNVKIRTVRG